MNIDDMSPEEIIKYLELAENVKSTEKKKGFFSWLKRMWNKTIFPDMIERKRAEKKIRKQIEHEARLEALSEMKGELKKQIKQKELDKLTGKRKSDILGKIAQGFGYDPNQQNQQQPQQHPFSKMNDMIGGNNQSNSMSNDKLSQMLGNNNLRQQHNTNNASNQTNSSFFNNNNNFNNKIMENKKRSNIKQKPFNPEKLINNQNFDVQNILGDEKPKRGRPKKQRTHEDRINEMLGK